MRHSINSAMKAFRDQALPWVSPYLGHGDVQLQLTAVSAVGKFGGVDGRVVLEQLRPQLDTNPLVRDQVRRFMR